jgi:hypothetical protein
MFPSAPKLEGNGRGTLGWALSTVYKLDIKEPPAPANGIRFVYTREPLVVAVVFGKLDNEDAAATNRAGCPGMADMERPNS